MQPELNIPLIAGAVQRLGDQLLTDYRKLPIPASKGELYEQLARIDKLSEETLKADLATAFPEIPWLIGDEFDAAGQQRPAALPMYWLCDAMDGAIQYLQHLPGWSINLVLIRDGQPYFSMIYAPLENDLFWAVDKAGAFLNGNRIHPSKKTDPGVMLAVFDYGHLDGEKANKDLNHRIGESVGELLKNFGIVRNYGPHGIQLASVGAGRIDLFYQIGLDTFNWLAGLLIAREAGAKVLTNDGRPWYWGEDSLLVASPQAAQILLENRKTPHQS